MSTPPTVEFWFEFASTYSYLSAARLPRLADNAGIVVRWRPFLLGPVFKAQGWNDSPFNLYPAKGRYMWRDMARLCASYDLPLRRPSAFPRNGLNAARIACAAHAEPWLPAFVQAVFHANFAADRDIAAPEVLRDCLRACGQEEAWLERAAQDGTKQALRANTEEALARGLFGAPSFVVGEEVFWGDDRLEQAVVWATGAAAPVAPEAQ